MRKKTLILYKSKTGFTKRYAEFIAAETGGTAMDIKKAAPAVFSSFDTIIFGGRMHAGRIDGLDDARKLFQKCGLKLSALFVTGAMPNTEAQTITKMWENNLTAEELAGLPHFYMQSGLCYEKMGFFDKTMMKMFAFMMKHKKGKSPDESRFAKSIASSYDISSEEYIWPLVKCLQDEQVH